MRTFALWVIFFIAFTRPPGLAGAAEWVQFDLISRPFFDPDSGRILKDVRGRKNGESGDRFWGGGKIYPDLSVYRVIKRFEKDGKLLVKIDTDAAGALALVSKSDTGEAIAAGIVRKSRHRTRINIVAMKAYGLDEFKPRRLTEAEAVAAIRDWRLGADRFTPEEMIQ